MKKHNRFFMVVYIYIYMRYNFNFRVLLRLCMHTLLLLFLSVKRKKKKKKRRQSNILNYLLHIYRRKKIFCIYIKINFILAVEWQSNTCLIYILIRRQKKKSKRRLNTMTFTISLNRQGYIYINLFVMNNITLKEKSF